MDVVIGLDCSTSAVKAVAFDAEGRVRAEARASLDFTALGEDRFEQDPADWWRAACEALRGLVAAGPGLRFAGLAISNQRETIAPLDADFRPTRPAILWLDGRAREDARAMAAEQGEALHRITGKVPDPNPALYKLAWMRRMEPDRLDASAYFAEVHSYLAWRMTGRFATSTASADPLGVFDLAAGCYATDLLERIGLGAENFAAALPPGTVIGELTPEAASTTGLPARLPIVTGGGDGQAAGVAVGLNHPGRAYLNLGTAIVSGVRSEVYRVGTAFRTMISAGAPGYVLETSLRSGTLLCDWLTRDLFGDHAALTSLEAEAAALPPGADGVFLLPYFLGVMTPHWDAGARGAILGLAPHHGRAHLLRALFEGIAQEQADVTARIAEATGIKVRELVAIGGGSRSDLWCSIIADVMAVPVLRSASAEASALGAAMAAAVGVGWFDDFDSAVAAMAGRITACFEPDPARIEAYAAQARHYRDIYPRLAGFAAS